MKYDHSRKCHREVARRHITSLNSLLECETLEIDKITATLETLIGQQQKIEEYDEKIQADLGGKNLLRDMEESDKIKIEINCMKTKVKRIMELKKIRTDISIEVSNTTLSEQIIFSGNPTEWNHFWKLFKIHVHKKEIKNSKKLSYLKKFLRGEPLELIEGLDHPNLEQVTLLLFKRYGTRKQLISSHLSYLIDLKPINENIKELRTFKIEYEKHIQALKELDTSIEEVGFAITQLLLRKLPKEIKDKINFVFSEEIMNLKELGEFIDEQIEITEKLSSTKASKTLDDYSNIKKDDKGFSDLNKNKIIECQLCYGNHIAENCTEYMDPHVRYLKVKDYSLCHRCLEPNHNTFQCTSKKSCRNCSNFHHTALCWTKNYV